MYRGCRALTFALARLSCYSYRLDSFYCKFIFFEPYSAMQQTQARGTRMGCRRAARAEAGFDAEIHMGPSQRLWQAEWGGSVSFFLSLSLC